MGWPCRPMPQKYMHFRLPLLSNAPTHTHPYTRTYLPAHMHTTCGHPPPQINLYDCLPSLHVNLLLDTEQTVAASEDLVDELAKAEARIEQCVLFARWPESTCEPRCPSIALTI